MGWALKVCQCDNEPALRSLLSRYKAQECGPVTSVAISASHMAVAGGHSSGHIMIWELEKPKTPFLHIPPVTLAEVADESMSGHLSDSAILHVGFLGTRHSATVSADDRGLSFSHLASRGLGSLRRSVTTTRILGRYPQTNNATTRTGKASSVLALAPLPLGNVERSTDSLGLTAMLTPYLLVIVSTTPIAQTQHKAPRPKELAPHSALSGCLAWFPAVKLKSVGEGTAQPVSRSKLVYCWSNIVTILEIDESDDANMQGKEASSALRFHARSRWKSSEAVVAVQWLSRSILGILTISQQLLILEDDTMRVTDSVDLLQKHLYHEDLFSRQLQPVVDRLDHDDINMHGVIADAFYMSLRAYKSRLFALGFNDLTVGTLSNWADRLMILMEDGDVISAIRLATTCYSGTGDKVTVGLPEDAISRYSMVREKLLGILAAASKYVLGRYGTGSEETATVDEVKELARVTLESSVMIEGIDYFFDEIYELYEEVAEDVILESLEEHVLNGNIKSLPPSVLKELINHYAKMGYTTILEEMICQLDTGSIDINQVTGLCKKHGLYDAYIYVWNEALQDYITPLIELLDIVQSSLIHVGSDESDVGAPAMRLFPYLAYTFTARRYPSGEILTEADGLKAKRDTYSFLFSDTSVEWPEGSGKKYIVKDGYGEMQNYPYLRLLLHYDACSFMSMLNEAFEDNYLNREINSEQDEVDSRDAPKSQGSGFVPSRQYIISVLLQVMFSDDFDSNQAIYLDMFIARNLPKFPQFILLSGSSLNKVLVDLCRYPTEEVAEECQLSVEYLLSMYRSPDLDSLIPLFEEARFWRVLKSIYRRERRYADLLRTCLKDEEDMHAVYDCVDECLRQSTALGKKELLEIEQIIIGNARELVSLDATRTAKTIGKHSIALLLKVNGRLEEGSQLQFALLRPLMEPVGEGSVGHSDISKADSTVTNLYVRLLCKFDSAHVADYVDGLKSGDLQLHEVLPAMEENGLVDSAVVLMARDGLVRQAMDRLVDHIATLKTALRGLLDVVEDSPDAANTKEAMEDLLRALEKNCAVGIWLCKGQTGNAQGQIQKTERKRSIVDIGESDLAPFELLWLDLLDAVVLTSIAIASVNNDSNKDDLGDTVGHEGMSQAKLRGRLRALVQQTFTALLVATSAEPKPDMQDRHNQTHPTFLRVLRAFLTRTAKATPLLSDLRGILEDIFSAYAFEESILSISNSFLESDLYLHVTEAKELRERGWRSKSQVCEICKRRAWGLGTGGDIWDAWERKLELDEALQMRNKIARSKGEASRRLARGKAKAEAHDANGASGGDTGSLSERSGALNSDDANLSSLVLFACRHMFHYRCLESESTKGEGGLQGSNGVGQADRVGLRCPLC